MINLLLNTGACISFLISQTRSGLEDYFMTKTSEFHTLLRNYRGIMGNIRINKIWISFDSCFFNYYADDDETFVDFVFQIKNVNTDILGIEDLVGSCEVEYNGTTLTKNYVLYVSSGSDIDKVYSWDGLDALDSTTLHVAITMPRELQTNGKSVTVKLTIAGQEKIINVR